MNTNEISGKRQMEFLAEFDYIREAGTVGEEKAATIIQETLNSFGVENHLEEFCFETFQVKKAKLTITEPYAKEYIVTGYGRCANTDENGRNESFLYVENADEISLANARGKIVMVNDPEFCYRNLPLLSRLLFSLHLADSSVSCMHAVSNLRPRPMGNRQY